MTDVTGAIGAGLQILGRGGARIAEGQQREALNAKIEASKRHREDALARAKKASRKDEIVLREVERRKTLKVSPKERGKSLSLALEAYDISASDLDLTESQRLEGKAELEKLVGLDPKGAFAAVKAVVARQKGLVPSESDEEPSAGLLEGANSIAASVGSYVRKLLGSEKEPATAAQEPSAQEPSAQEPSAQEPSAQEPKTVVKLTGNETLEELKALRASLLQ